METNKVCISKNVLFYENIFPHKIQVNCTYKENHNEMRKHTFLYSVDERIATNFTMQFTYSDDSENMGPNITIHEDGIIIKDVESSSASSAMDQSREGMMDRVVGQKEVIIEGFNNIDPSNLVKKYMRVRKPYSYLKNFVCAQGKNDHYSQEYSRERKVREGKGIPHSLCSF